VLQLFKVSEIAEKLEKTKDSVYKKTNRLKMELKPHKKNLNGLVYYDTEGFEIIKKSYSKAKEATTFVKSSQNDDENKYLHLLLAEKDKQIGHLKEQLSKQEKSLEKVLELANQTQHLLAIEKQHVLQIQEPPVKKKFWDRFKNCSIK
jgi:hypothetical protein